VKIVFLDQFGSFASVVAAAYCTGILHEQVNYKEILALPFFAEKSSNQPGECYYLGKDKDGNEFYTLGVGLYGNFIATVAGPEMLKMLEAKENISLYDLSAFNPVFLNILEIVTGGKLRDWSKYLWAYYLSKKMSIIIKMVKMRIRS
jgi:hypothetical protein